MPERPPRQLPPRPDPGGADMDTQVDLGWAEPQPEPAPPEEPAPVDEAVEAAHIAFLDEHGAM
ncbi:hypothetical protein AB0M57_04840 [Streptomyces sp. NPDC051597]|uniref:hypothetical protein n=1 Tax=Streptomyces sp. NPDC051597 TaxID=3155049 RepID=UPI003418CD85